MKLVALAGTVTAADPSICEVTDQVPGGRSANEYTASLAESVARMARAAGAKCYTDPFAPENAASEQRSFLARATAWFGSDSPPPVPDMARSMQAYYDREAV